MQLAMQTNQDVPHSYLPFIYCCTSCGETFWTARLLLRDQPHICPKCDTEADEYTQLCQWCAEPCDPTDILCASCKETVVCYAEMPTITQKESVQ